MCLTKGNDELSADDTSRKPKLPTELIVRIVRLLRDRKVESLNKSVHDPDPNDIMRTMQRVCRSWYMIVTPMLYVDSIFGLRYLSPPIRFFLKVLVDDRSELITWEAPEKHKHPIDWPVLLRMRWILSHIRRLRYIRHYTALEYQWGRTDVWPNETLYLGDLDTEHDMFPSLMCIGFDFTNSNPYFENDRVMVHAITLLLKACNHGIPPVCFHGGRGRGEIPRPLLFDDNLLEKVTCHLDPLGLRSIAPEGIADCSVLTIDFQDSMRLAFRNKRDRLNEIDGTVQYIKPTDCHYEKLVVLKMEVGEEEQAAFGEDMDGIFKQLEDRACYFKHLKWSYLDQPPDEDGKIRCRCCTRVMGKEAI